MSGSNSILSKLFLLIIAMMLTGCLLPSEPTSWDFTRVDNSHADFTVRQMARNMNPYENGPKQPPVAHGPFDPTMPGYRSRAKNLLFVTADDLLESQFQPMIADAYHNSTPPTLNELSWWQFVPYFRDLYYKVIYLPLPQAKYENIAAALDYLETQNLPYDVIILSHGYPNYLTNGKTGYFFSYKEIDDRKGKLPHLNMVFTQGCYSSSLSQDWLATGAKTVISFDGLNRNFFFIGVFLDRYRKLDAESAFTNAVAGMPKALESSGLYSTLIEQGLGMSVPDYLNQVDEPKLATMSNPSTKLAGQSQ